MVIRMRHTKGHTGNRRSHHALKNRTLAIDPETGTKHLRHRVNPTTGMYKGRQVLNIVKKVEKKQKKAKAKTA
ncbi:MAG: ribosomal protein large subunit ribosomal protein [Bacteroidota bacterium]|jgi:large subunit ribosomal protein L32